MSIHERSIAPRAFQVPVIAGVEITTDAQGRFNLNALHKASGLDDHKRPSKWLATQQAQELIAELKGQSPNSGFGVLNVVKGGHAPGTFAAEELAVSYAGWISPSFQLEVNRTFIACRKGEVKGRDLAPSASASREARLLFKQFMGIGKEMKLDGNQIILSANRATKSLTGIDMMGEMGIVQIEAPQQEASLNPSDIGARLGGRTAKVINLALTASGFQKQFRDAKGHPYYEPTDKGVEAGAIMVDTGKRTETGIPVRQLRWAGGIVAQLHDYLEGGAA
ncbi:KilA-N domain-containing protein [Falsirhodobacter xinxiangensis]|uniref:KilA-N domain-containing protein n=1 Tax=Falsirhodobacter xinxiangensis TaxID=2530049 RepID=UPI001C6FE17D|nr:KilA-N domain-containing protein [Rhodobacter xinxiangensis]